MGGRTAVASRGLRQTAGGGVGEGGEGGTRRDGRQLWGIRTRGIRVFEEVELTARRSRLDLVCETCTYSIGCWDAPW